MENVVAEGSERGLTSHVWVDVDLQRQHFACFQTLVNSGLGTGKKVTGVTREAGVTGV